MSKPLPFAMILLALALVVTNATRADSPDPRIAGYRVAPGYKVAIAATEPMVINPVTMTWGPDGRLYVIEWKEGREPNDHIKALSDTDGDGTFDKAELFMSGFDLPAGIAFWDGWTYITLDHDVVRFHDPDLDGKYDKREVIATGFGNDNSHHRVSGLVFGPDGWLYMTTGDSDCRAKGSDGSTATILRSGGVLRCKADGSKLEVVASGMRNPWGNVAFDDEFHIFHTDNDNEGAPGFTGCRLLHVVDGGDYGWRLREGARCCAPDFERATWNGGRPGRLGWMAETGRGAPAGLCVLNSAAFPPSTRNLLVYPDVFRKSVRAYTLRPRGSTYLVDKEFELLASDEGLFRPTDAEIGPDGALYILDWRTDSGGAGKLSGNGTTGRIYRVTWGGKDKEPARKTLPRDRIGNLAKAEDADLIEALKSDDYGLRRSANLELIRRGGGSVRLRDVILDAKNPVPTRRHAMAVSAAVRPQAVHDFVYFQRMDAGTDLTLKRFGLELIARFGPPHDASALVSIAQPPVGDDPQSRRALFRALGRFNQMRRARPGEDPSFVEATKHALAEIGVKKGDDFTKVTLAQKYRFSVLLAESVSTDLSAKNLVKFGVSESQADPFLRDAITRGLEQLGPTGLEWLIKAVSSDDPKRVEAALYALQGWRSRDGIDAIISSATGSAEIPANARAGLFRTLRELVADVPPTPIANWLANNPKADPSARVEAIRVLSAMHNRAALDAASALPVLLKDDNPDVRKAALGLAGEAKSAEVKAALLEIVQGENRPADERRLALAAIRGYEDKSLAPTLAGLFTTSDDAGYLSELLRTIASQDFASAARLAESALKSKNPDLRREAISLLGQKPDSALVVARLYNDGKLPKEDLAIVVEAVRNHSSPELQAATQQMLKRTLLAAPRGDEAQRLREFVAKNGNPERGKAIFTDAKRGNCMTCHRLEGSGGSVGPDLTRMWQTLSFDKRVESLLEPSKEIKEGFNTTKVATKDGRVSVGLLLSSTPDAVTLRDAQGREVRIPAAEIEEKSNDPTSLMPAGVVGHLSFAELADLLAFLGDQKTQESLKK